MFTKEQLESAPSLQDGMPLQQERAVRNSTCKFIQKVGQHTHPACKPMSVSTARVFFHRVCMSQSVVEGRQNPKLLGVACLFLACKSEEELKPVREFIWSMNQIACEVDAHGKATYPYGTFAGDAAKPVDRHGRRRKPWMVEEETSEFQKVKENILQVERLILQVLDFDFTVRHPIAHIRVRACIPCNPTSALASSLKRMSGQIENRWPKREKRLMAKTRKQSNFERKHTHILHKHTHIDMIDMMAKT